jgi:hypothetical protein
MIRERIEDLQERGKEIKFHWVDAAAKDATTK